MNGELSSEQCKPLTGRNRRRFGSRGITSPYPRFFIEINRRDGILVDINSRHDLVGEARQDESSVAFYWKRSDEKFEFLGTLGGNESCSLAVSDEGVVVGYSLAADGKSHGFIWVDGQMFDLNDLVDMENGWVIEEANDVNNKGQVLALAKRGSTYKSLLLTPN